MSLTADMSRWRLERAQRVEAIRTSLEETLAYLRHLGAERVVLFGSAAASPGTFSDIDLIVVMSNVKSSAEWCREIYRDAPRRVATDMLVYNRSDFDEIKTRSRFVRHALATGRVIHEADG